MGMAKGAHVTRYYMYRHLARYAEQRDERAKVLSLSHSEGLARLLGFNDAQITNVSYPEVNVLKLPFDDETFDAVVSDQVLEHVEGDPWQAIAEIFRVMKTGGLSLQTTCFINPVHGAPSDFWRFTPEALSLMTQKHGKVIDAGGWGNPWVWTFVAAGLRSQPIPHAQWHPAHWRNRTASTVLTS